MHRCRRVLHVEHGHALKPAVPAPTRRAMPRRGAVAPRRTRTGRGSASPPRDRRSRPQPRDAPAAVSAARAGGEASGGGRPRSTAMWSQLLHVEAVALYGAHADAFVQSHRARRIPRVDLEADAPNAVFVQPRESLTQKRLAEPSPARTDCDGDVLDPPLLPRQADADEL